MTNKESNLNSDVKQDLFRRSEFLKQVTSFAQFMNKEHIEPSGSERTLLVCASDGTIGDGKLGAMNILLGSEQSNIIALSKMMANNKMSHIFRRAWVMARMHDEMIGELPTMRRRLRTLYAITAGIFLWALLLILMAVVGFCGWITTVSCLMLMGYLTLLTVRDIRDKRRRIEAVRNQERRDHDDRLSLMGEAFMHALKRYMENYSADDNNEND